jgi:hypothetical protein
LSCSCQILGKQPTLSDNIRQAVAARLEDKDGSVRATAIKALGKQPALSDNILEAVVARLEDEDRSVRDAVIETLSNQPTSSGNILKDVLGNRKRTPSEEHPGTVLAINNLASTPRYQRRGGRSDQEKEGSAREGEVHPLRRAC